MGSNQDDPLAQLERAVAALADLLEAPRLGPLYRSPPEAGLSRPLYLNTAVTARSELAPEVLLAIFKQLEWRAGRRPAKRGAPRPLDLDLVLCGSLESRRPELTLPHPRLRQRPFVLEPLAALAPDWLVPPDDATLAELARRAPRMPALEPVSWGAMERLEDVAIDRSAALD